MNLKEVLNQKNKDRNETKNLSLSLHFLQSCSCPAFHQGTITERVIFMLVDPRW
jgi:hypothetical protein